MFHKEGSCVEIVSSSSSLTSGKSGPSKGKGGTKKKKKPQQQHKNKNTGKEAAPGVAIIHNSVLDKTTWEQGTP